MLTAIIIGSVLTFGSLFMLWMAARNAPTYDEVSRMEVDADGNLIEVELIF